MPTLRLSCVLVAALLVTACGGGSDIESLVEERASVMNDLADIIESVEDADSMEAAKPKLRDLGKQMAELTKNWEQLASESGSADDVQAMAEQTKEMLAATSRLKAAFMKLALNPELRDQLEELGKELGDVFDAKR